MRPLSVFLIPWLLFGTGPGHGASEEVSWSTADGMTLQGTFYPPEEEPAPGLLLLHDWGRERADWEDLAEELQEEDYAVLTLDLRGHGQSTRKGAQTLRYSSMSEADGAQAVQDVQTAYQYLLRQERVDADQIALGGAGWGANLALRFAARERRVKTLALLSPALTIKGLRAVADMDRYGERPVFLAASLKDHAAADAVTQLEKAARGERRVKFYENAGHGAEMLKKEDELTDLILDWWDDTL